MITVLKYQRYLGLGRKRGRRLGKPRLLSRFLNLAQYRCYFKTVAMYCIYMRCDYKIGCLLFFAHAKDVIITGEG